MTAFHEILFPLDIALKSAGGPEHWAKHKVFDVVDNESPTFGDVTGDGKPEILCMSGGYIGYAAPDWNDAAKPMQPASRGSSRPGAAQRDAGARRR